MEHPMTETEIRQELHRLIDRVKDVQKLNAILTLLDPDDALTAEDIAAINQAKAENVWIDWRDIRDDV
jgi:glucuronate isomerase